MSEGEVKWKARTYRSEEPVSKSRFRVWPPI